MLPDICATCRNLKTEEKVCPSSVEQFEWNGTFHTCTKDMEINDHATSCPQLDVFPLCSKHPNYHVWEHGCVACLAEAYKCEKEVL